MLEMIERQSSYVVALEALPFLMSSLSIEILKCSFELPVRSVNIQVQAVRRTSKHAGGQFVAQTQLLAVNVSVCLLLVPGCTNQPKTLNKIQYVDRKGLKNLPRLELHALEYYFITTGCTLRLVLSSSSIIKVITTTSTRITTVSLFATLP
jgi:hypothetical protein